MLTPFYLARASYKKGDLLTMKQIAEKAGVDYQYIRALRCGDEKSKPPFPRPYTQLGQSPLWIRNEINVWIFHRDRYRETGRRMWEENTQAASDDSDSV